MKKRIFFTTNVGGKRVSGMAYLKDGKVKKVVKM